MLPRSGLGILAFYALLCGVAYLLQLAPSIGIIVMVLGGMIWVGILIHLAMLHLAAASLTGTISRVWLVVPIAYYAAGYALHLVSVQQVQDRIAAIERANAATVIKAEQPFSFLEEGSGAFELLELYRADRAFIRRADGSVTTRYYAEGEACREANKDYNVEKRKEPFLLRANLPVRSLAKRQCIISQDGLLAEWHYRIMGEYLKEENDLLYRHFGSRWVVFDERSGAQLGSVEIGGFQALPPVQTVTAGCALDSGAARWVCGTSLMHELAFVPVGYRQRTDRGSRFIPINDPDTWEITPLARALSLEPRRVTD